MKIKNIQNKTPYRDIYTVLRLNRFIVIIVCSLALLSVLYFGFLIFKMQRELLGHAFAVRTDGSILPLELVEEEENLEIEALAHLRIFHQYFYDIDPSNYESSLEKALWLGNHSVAEVYR